MELVLATHKLADTGGAQTYVLTIGEQLARLGHSVTLYALELGLMAEAARERALRVTSSPGELPARADGVITGVHQGLALELAGKYPDASRLFVVHSSEDIHLPPAVPGAVAATIVLNDLHAARAAAYRHTGEIVRLRQPVDLRRYYIQDAPHKRPEQVLLLGNYHRGHTDRTGALREAWARAELRWVEAGGEAQTLNVPAAIAEADVVVGYGRSMLEAMACGRPAYVHDQAGSEGWITPQTYARMEAGGFAVASVRLPPDRVQLEADLEAYRPEWGLAGRDIARTRHDARDHAAALVSLLERLGPGKPCAEQTTVRALEQLAESQLRAELMAEHYRVESKQWFTLYHEKQQEIAREREDWLATRAELGHERDLRQTAQAELTCERDSRQATQEQLERDLATSADAAARAHGLLEAHRRTRRYRLAQTVARPLDTLRGRSGP